MIFNLIGIHRESKIKDEKKNENKISVEWTKEGG